jgi:hypothetical protein
LNIIRITAVNLEELILEIERVSTDFLFISSFKILAYLSEIVIL